MHKDLPVLKMYSDFKSPYAYLAFEPFFDLASRYDITVRWMPFQLRIKGSGQRSVYSEYKVKYSYMDARRCGNARGLWLKGPLKIFDTEPALIGGLFAQQHGKLREYGAEAFRSFFMREFAADESAAVADLIAKLGMSREDYLAFLSGEGKRLYDATQEEASEDHVFGVPLFILEGEQFWGYDRMPMLEERLRELGLAKEGRAALAAEE